VDRGAIDFAALKRKVLEILACICESLGLPHFPKLNASAEIEITDKRTSLSDDTRQSFCGNVLVELRGVHVRPQLSIEAVLLPGFGDNGASYNLFWLKVGEYFGSDFRREISPEVEVCLLCLGLLSDRKVVFFLDDSGCCGEP